MSRIRDLHLGWMNDPTYRDAYDALEEFALAAALIRARADAGLMQEQLANTLTPSNLKKVQPLSASIPLPTTHLYQPRQVDRVACSDRRKPQAVTLQLLRGGRELNIVERASDNTIGAR